jgi:GMP synthase-like glutamine amidotransferase
MDYLAHLTVIQHTSASYLGLIEDHLEGRKIRFTYHRPFTERGGIPTAASIRDGLILLGGGPWGSAGPRDVPTLVREVELVHHCLNEEIPVLGFELGAQILCLAGGGRTISSPLSFRVGSAVSTQAQALGGYLPQEYVNISYARDTFELPTAASVLAVDDHGAPALFQLGAKALGFAGHPGFKPAIAEDLLMEFEETPPEPLAALEDARGRRTQLENDLVPIMTGIVGMMGWMDALGR